MCTVQYVNSWYTWVILKYMVMKIMQSNLSGDNLLTLATSCEYCSMCKKRPSCGSSHFWTTGHWWNSYTVLNWRKIKVFWDTYETIGWELI